MIKFTFKPLEEKDLDLLCQWFNECMLKNGGMIRFNGNKKTLSSLKI